MEVRNNKVPAANSILRHTVRVVASFAVISCLAASAFALDNAGTTTKPNAAAPAFFILDGSTTFHRGPADSVVGSVCVYVGGRLPVGNVFGQLRFLFDGAQAGNLTGYITPLVFQQIFPNVYTVVGIGKGFPVISSPFAQGIPFVVGEGIGTPYNNTFTFGFVNALVGLRGLPLLSSPGTVDFNYSEDGGNGVGGLGTTNAWGATGSSAAVSLGSTFGIAGSGALYTFVPGYRTYSALATGIAP